MSLDSRLTRFEYFYKELSVTNAGGPVWQSVAASATLTNYGTDNSSGSVYVPPRAETFAHDADGNLTNDGRWSYTWDAENRLVRMETKSVATNAGLPPLRLLFAYDPEGRRTAKGVLLWTNNVWTVTLSNRFVYDGWNLVAELNGTNNALIRSYAWGLDLSGAMQSVGGVGGLLWMNAYFAANDGNGNVLALVTHSNSVVAAEYQYGPFGEVIRTSGTAAKENPFRSSTKYEDDETDLFYYGHRYYSSSLGRWASRDPLGEAPAMNSYAFVNNEPVTGWDVLGRWVYSVHFLRTAEWAEAAGVRQGFAATIGQEDNNVDSNWRETSLPMIGDQKRHMFYRMGKDDSRDYYYNLGLKDYLKWLQRADQERDPSLCWKAGEAFGKGLHSRQDKSAHRKWPSFIKNSPNNGAWSAWTMHPGWWDAWNDYEYTSVGISDLFWERANKDPENQPDYYPWAKAGSPVQAQQRASQNAARTAAEQASKDALKDFVDAVRNTCVCRQYILTMP